MTHLSLFPGWALSVTSLHVLCFHVLRFQKPNVEKATKANKAMEINSASAKVYEDCLERTPLGKLANPK
jgi:hypothetical protein